MDFFFKFSPSVQAKNYYCKFLSICVVLTIKHLYEVDFSVINSYFLYRYDTRDDFTVVLQPFFDHTIIPRKPDGSVDRSFFAPDCFHFSGKAHAASALALWNAMLEPVGKKVRT